MNIVSLYSANLINRRKNSIISSIIKKYVNNKFNKNLIHLIKLENKTESDSWFYDSISNQMVRITINDDKNKKIPINKYCNQYNYQEINFDIKEINRNQYIRSNYPDIKQQQFPFKFSIDLYNQRKHFISIKHSEIKNINTNRKRPRSFTDEEIFKWEKMISPSNTYNYFKNDTLLDFLKMYNIKDINDKPNKTFKNSNNNFNSLKNNLLQNGNNFEKHVEKYIKNKEKDYVYICGDNDNVRDNDKVLETIEHIKKGTKIIFQPLFYNEEDYMFGKADILMRSDIVKDFFVNVELDEKYNNKFYYVVIDIKFSSLKVSSKGFDLLNDNSSSQPFIKSQLYIYNKCLSKIQNYFHPQAFVIGKRLMRNNKKIKLPFMKNVAIIDFNNKDKHVKQQVKNAINWYHRLIDEGDTWTLLPPSNNELRPNMKNNNDGSFRQIKEVIAKETNEITSVIYCGVKQRQKAFENNVFSYKDNNCSSEIMGINQKSKRAKIIDNILDINRSNNKINLGSLLENNDWKELDKKYFMLYIDFETLNSCVGEELKGKKTYEDASLMTYLVGTYYKNNFKYFILKEKTDEAEYEMFNEFQNYIKELEEKSGKKVLVVHYSNAEMMFYNHMNKKFDNHFNKLNNFDLCKLLKDNYVAINGCLSYKLKDVVSSMYNNSLINIKYDDKSECVNGIQAMVKANEVFENNDNKMDEKEPIIKDIIKYNKVDVISLYQIFCYLKSCC